MQLHHLSFGALALALVCGIASIGPIATAEAAKRPTAIRISAEERVALKQINRFRKARKLAPLRIDLKLQRTARWHAKDMARRDYFSHTDSHGRNPFARMASFGYPGNTWRGENIAAGNPGGADTYKQWLHSPSHKVNMQHRRFRAIGIARYCDRSSTYRCYWVTNFGSTVSTRVRVLARR